MKNRKQAAVGFIFITLLLDVIGIGIIAPVMPKLITEMIHGTTSQASSYGGWLFFSYSVMQFLASPILGNLSDQYGRRPVLLFSLFGFGIDYLFLAFAPSIGWLFLGRIIAGITGASFTTATAYIADISTPEKKAQNFGMVGAAFGLGFIIGPVLGGLLGGFGSRVPFLVAAFLSLANWLYGYFILPESLSLQHRRKFEWRRANPIGSLKFISKHPALLPLVFSYFFLYVSGNALNTTLSFYGMEKFNWTSKEIGISLGVVGIMVSIVQGLLIRKTSKILGHERSAYTGILFYMIGMVLFALANQGWMMYAITVIYCLGGISGPSLQAIISNHIQPNEQGALQGALTSVVSISSIIGPPVMTNLFSYCTRNKEGFYLPGAPFFLGALLMMISAIVVYKTLYTEKKSY
jgi:DHA1 family tetracycline resistance protein-like MFS transporter